MKSYRRSLSSIFVSINILIILLLTFSIVAGVFRITYEWSNGVTQDAADLVEEILADEYPGTASLQEFTARDFELLSGKLLDKYPHRLRFIRFKVENELLYETLLSIPEYEIPSGVLKWTAEFLFSVAKLRPEKEEGEIQSLEGGLLGTIEVHTVPLLGYRNTTNFDRIITKSLIVGIILALIFSIIISITASKKISGESGVFASQLTELAAGSRTVSFLSSSTEEMKSAADAADKLQSELKLKEELQQKWLQDIVHDLRNPVSALHLQFEAVKDGVLVMDEKRVNLLSNEVRRIDEMIAELSELTRIRSEVYTTVSEIFSLQEFLVELEGRFTAVADGKDISLKVEIKDDVGDIEFNRQDLTRIMNNLIINAINNSAENQTVKIFAATVEAVSGKTRIVIGTENNGFINEDDLPYLFDRLYRSLNSGYEGSGLGLAISKALTEKNNGTLTVRNTEYGTVVFEVHLNH